MVNYDEEEIKYFNNAINKFVTDQNSEKPKALSGSIYIPIDGETLIIGGSFLEKECIFAAKKGGNFIKYIRQKFPSSGDGTKGIAVQIKLDNKKTKNGFKILGIRIAGKESFSGWIVLELIDTK
jgi:hypothetical protein